LAFGDVPPPPVVEETVVSTGGYIPEPPAIPDENIVLNTLGEATLQSLGLGSNWTPVGWIQQLLEAIHVNLDLPWYSSIVVLALILRTFLLPIVVKSQKNAANMRKHAPHLGVLQSRYEDAQNSGNQLECKKN
jgi:YidC/Oxa1 family membrane protein insertase